jgi:hypothetical protein
VRPKPADLAKLGSAPEWSPLPSTLEATAGFHRFYWPLRHSAPGDLTENDPYADGVWALPEEYKVTLSVDGTILEESLKVAGDPRVGLAPEAYRAQFLLAKEIEDERSRLAKVGLAVDRLLEEVERAIGVAGGRDGRAGETLDAFRARLLRLAGKPPAGSPPNAWWLGGREPESVRFTAGALAGLAEAVDGADAAPSPDSRQGLVATRPLVDAVEAAWRAILERELPALQRKLRALGAPGILPVPTVKG